MTATIDHWDATDHVRAMAAEALLAELLHLRNGPGSTVWEAPRHAGYDVTSVERDGTHMLVDAKVATMTRAAISSDEMVDVIEWHGHNDFPLVKDPTTHLGLIVLADSARVELRDIEGAPGSLRLHGELRAAHAFLIPAQVANDHATAIWSTRAQAPSNGRYRYLAVEHLEGRSLLPAELSA